MIPKIIYGNVIVMLPLVKISNFGQNKKILPSQFNLPTAKTGISHS